MLRAVSVEELVDYLMEMNRRRSAEFLDNIIARRQYRGLNRAEILVTECMDGRVDFGRFCQAPYGMLQVMENIGGRHDLGWPLVAMKVEDWYEYSRLKDRPAVAIITYHWSASDPHKGCAGFNYDRDAAFSYNYKTMRQFSHCFGPRIHQMLWGMETDSEALIVHGSDIGKTLDMREYAQIIDPEFYAGKLRELFPGVSDAFLLPLVPLLRGNAAHVTALRNSPRSEDDLRHCERVLALGDCFDWVDEHNFILTVGPGDPNLDEAVVKAAAIIQSNQAQGRIGAGSVLLVAVGYEFSRFRRLAEEQARFLASFATKHVGAHLPGMKFHILAGTVNRDDRSFSRFSI